MQINFAKKFKKQYEKAEDKIQTAFDRRFKLFLQDTHNSLLNNHLLTGKYSGKRSINITGDWRAIYSESYDKEKKQVVNFEALGTHSQLYA